MKKMYVSGISMVILNNTIVTGSLAKQATASQF